MTSRNESGLSLVSTLASIVIVLVLGAVLLSTAIGGGPSTTTSTGGGSGATTTSAPTTLTGAVGAAARAECVSDVATVASALATYETLNGAAPPAGTAWATSAGGPLAGQSWPSGGAYFSITWTGSTIAIVPLRGTHAHDSGLSSAVACNDL